MSESEIDTNQYTQPFWHKRSVIILIMLSLLFGIVGGGLGTWVVLTNPRLTKLLNISNYTQQTVQNGIYKESSAVIDVVKSASPSVVSIVVKKNLSSLPGLGLSPYNGIFLPFGITPSFPDSGSSSDQLQEVGAGTGFFVSSDGLILTNRHVVSDEDASYSIVTNDGKTYDAKVLARDPINDLAIMKVEISGAPALNLADSSTVEVGQQVVAIGNSLGQYQNTVTSGIVSGTARSIIAGDREGSEVLDGVIQTDAAINPGNSGGPLLNLAGQVIGINTAVDQGGQSVGFAIPSSDATKALASFQAKGKITRPYLGVRYILISDLVAKQNGLDKDYGAWLVAGRQTSDPAILPGSPAAKAGLQENDIILAVGGSKVDEQNPLPRILKQYNAGEIIDMQIYRNGKDLRIKATLGESDQ